MEKVRDFTEIELAIIERIIIQILNLMREPWENVISIKTKAWKRLKQMLSLHKLYPRMKWLHLITLSAKVGDVEGMINICIPHMVVEPIVSKLSTRFWFSNIEKETTQRDKGSY